MKAVSAAHEVRPVRTIRSKLIPLLITDLDTDQIIPSRYIASRTPDEFAAALFADRRAADPQFVLNQPRMADRRILLTGANFGCGSSREAAAWALRAGGIDVVIATSFGDIFRSNAVRNGIVLATLSQGCCAELEAVALGEPEQDVTVDLAKSTVAVADAGFAVEFAFDEFYRHLLISGLTELDYLMALEPATSGYEVSKRINRDARRRM